MKKINFKKVISLGFSLAMGLSITLANSFASAPLMDFRLGVANSDAQKKNQLCECLARDFLLRCGYEGDISEEVLGLFAWDIAQKVQAMGFNEDFERLMSNPEYYGAISCELIFPNINPDEIIKRSSRYGEEVINTVVCSMLGTAYATYYDIDENTFDVVEYILSNEYRYGADNKVFPVDVGLYNNVRKLLSLGANLENIDLLEQSFYGLVLRPEEIVCNGNLIKDHVMFLINRFNSYNEKIIKSRITLSDRAEKARRQCKESIEWAMKSIK